MRREHISVHELMKDDIIPGYSQSRNNQSENKNKQDDKEHIEHYVMLDSFVKIERSATEYGEYKWILNTLGQTLNESVGVNEEIENVIQIQIGTFYIPLIEDVPYTLTSLNNGDVLRIQNNSSLPGEPPTLITQSGSYGQYSYSILNPADASGGTYIVPWPNNPYSQIPFANKISIYVQESSQQSYANFNNTRYNFEFIAMHNNRLNGNPHFIQVKPVNGARWDEFNFTRPLPSLSTVTLVFRNPDTTIAFEPDVMYNSIIKISTGAPPNYILIQTQFTHKLKMGDRIYIRNILPYDSTVAPLPQYLSNYLTRSDGHTAGEIVPSGTLQPGLPIPSGTGLDFGLDPALEVSLAALPVLSLSFPILADVYIAKRRLRIPMKIKCLKRNKNKY